MIKWYWRKALFALCELRHALLPEKPKYKIGDEVYVAFRHAGSDPTTVKCRIREVNYWYHSIVYGVVALEDKDWIWYGRKDIIFPEKIDRKSGEFYG